MSEVTHILHAIEQGDRQASEQLLPLVYEELRQLAVQRMAQEKPGQTLQATALVHEAYLRLVGIDPEQHWDNRRHFFAGDAAHPHRQSSRTTVSQTWGRGTTGDHQARRFGGPVFRRRDP